MDSNRLERPAAIRPIRAALWLAWLVLWAAACRAPAAPPDPPPADPRPADVPRASFSSTIWIGAPRGTRIEGYASAVVLGPRHLLTNAHVWSEEPWPGDSLPARRELALFEGGRLVSAGFRLVASGDAGDAESDDWVLLEADAPRWDAAVAARVHSLAADPAWRVGEGSVLAVVGYTSIFVGDGAPTRDSKGAERSVAWEEMAPFLERGPYALLGEAVRVEGRPAVRYPAGWPPPVGHSGGGVYLWDEARERALLVGLFTAWVPTRVVVTHHRAPLGLSALASERVTEEDGWVLAFVPLAPALAALERARR